MIRVFRRLTVVLQLSDNKDSDVSMALRSFREGDRVKAVILSVDTERRRISFGLKPSYFTEGDFEAEGDEASEDDEESGEQDTLGVVDNASDSEAEDGEDEDDEQQDGGASEEEAEQEDVDDDSDDDDGDKMEVDFDSGPSFVNNAQTKSATSSAPALELGAGFQWSVRHPEGDEDAPSSSDEDDDEDTQASKKKKRRRKEIEQDLTADLHTKTPESNADFERLLLGSPNSSYLWVQYMSFQLQLSEVEKAREIARRAMKTINFREEQEKLNVWIALLNLENIYGTEASLEATFKDAARHNDSKTVHLRLAAILDQSEKVEV